MNTPSCLNWKRFFIVGLLNTPSCLNWKHFFIVGAGLHFFAYANLSACHVSVRSKRLTSIAPRPDPHPQPTNVFVRTFHPLHGFRGFASGLVAHFLEETNCEFRALQVWGGIQPTDWPAAACPILSAVLRLNCY